MTQYFPKPYESFGGNISVKTDLSNYVAKTHTKIFSHVVCREFYIKIKFNFSKN